jgi:murein tripeptide amidase MpaA
VKKTTHRGKTVEGRDCSDAVTTQSVWGHQEKEETRKSLPLETSEGAWPWPHIGIKLLASTTLELIAPSDTNTLVTPLLVRVHITERFTNL